MFFENPTKKINIVDSDIKTPPQAIIFFSFTQHQNKTNLLYMRNLTKFKLTAFIHSPDTNIYYMKYKKISPDNLFDLYIITIPFQTKIDT